MESQDCNSTPNLFGCFGINSVSTIVKFDVLTLIRLFSAPISTGRERIYLYILFNYEQGVLSAF